MTWDSSTKLLQGACVGAFKRDDGPYTYRPLAGGSYPVEGIFDENYDLLEPGSEMQVSSTHVVLGIERSELQADPVEDDQVTVGTTNFKVKRAIPDGEGFLVLVLKLA